MFQVSGPVLWDSDKSQPDPGVKSNLRAPPVLWPLTDQEELKRQVYIRCVHEPLTLVVVLSGPNVTVSTSLSAASVSVSGAPPSLHEHWERASEGEQTEQETPEEDGKVTRLFYSASLPLIGVVLHPKSVLSIKQSVAPKDGC